MQIHESDAKVWLKKKVLRQNELFSDLDDARLEYLINNGTARLLAAGEALYHKGEETNDTFCIIIFGTMNILGDDGKVVKAMKGGEILGEISLIGLYRKRTADVVAVEATSILEWTFTDIKDKAPYMLPKLQKAALKKLRFTQRAA